MTQIHKTPHFVQQAVRTYIEENKTYPCQVVEGMAFDELELPCIAVVMTSQSTLFCANGATGTKAPAISVMLQTSYATSEEEHWDLWSEIEDLFNKPQSAVLTALNLCTSELNFQRMEIGDLINVVDSDVRKTLLELTFLTNLK